jgi:sec-independent protein translocase protein TatC
MNESLTLDPEYKQPLIAHMTEMRNRLLYCVAFIGLVFIGLFYVANDLYALLSEPLRAHLPESSNMIATGVASPFLTPFKLSFVVAIFVSMPFIFYQAWLFVKPGLKRNEVSLAFPLLASSIMLFYIGISFAYFVVFPLIFGFFSNAAPEGVMVMTDIASYLDFVIKLFFAFGFAFEIPIATILLILMGITTRASLAQKRPYIFVGCFIIGMLLTPPDILSQWLLAIPMWLLFELGLVMSLLITKKEESNRVSG